MAYLVASLVIAVLLVLSGPLQAADARALSLPRTHLESMQTASGDTYNLYVALPRDYETRKDRFPVVYLLDADYAFAIVRNIVEHLSDRRDVQEAVIVGIAYPDGIEGDGWLRRYRIHRTRDYTPTRSPVGYPDGVQDHSGGADKFLAFLAQRLVPDIDRRFRTTPQRVLVGHSYGGLFGAYAVLAGPALFTGAILVSPSLWYDRGFVFRFEANHPISLKNDSRLELFLAAGAAEASVDGDIAGDVRRLAKRLTDRRVPGLDVRAVVLDDETHNSVFPAAVSKGLRALLGTSGKSTERANGAE